MNMLDNRDYGWPRNLFVNPKESFEAIVKMWEKLLINNTKRTYYMLLGPGISINVPHENNWEKF